MTRPAGGAGPGLDAEFEAAVGAALSTRFMARVLEVHEAIGSTNDRAKALARAGAPHGLAVVAHAQTAGRGQRGRGWDSPPGLGLYVSFLVRPRLAPAAARALPLLAAVALHDALRAAAGLWCEIKWPNDLLARGGAVHRRKLAGILVELSADAQRVQHAVIGVGVNLREGPRPPALARYATSVEAALVDAGSPPDVSPTRILATLANALERRLHSAERDGFAAVADAWSARAAGLGEDVEVYADGEHVRGSLAGIGPNGALELRGSDGVRSFHGGELRLPGAPARPSEAATEAPHTPRIVAPTAVPLSAEDNS